MAALVLSVLPLPGARTVRLDLPRRATESPTADLHAELALPRRTARGRVETTEHTPLAGATVRAILVLQGRTWDLGRTSTAADGTFSLPGLPEGSYWLVASAPGRARAMATVRIHGREPETTALALAEGRRVEGTVTAVDREGARPFEGAVVRATREGAEGAGWAARVTADGGFTLEGLEEGTYRIEVSESGYESVHRVGIGAGATGVSLSLRALASVEGVVRNDRGAGEPGAVVVLAGSGVWPPRRIPVLADGSFEVPGLPAGVYELRASRDDEVAEPVAPLLLEPGDHRTVALALSPGAAITGTVLDADTLRPVAGARVVVVEDALSTAPRALSSGAAGEFRVGGLLRRSHQVSVRAAGYAPRTGLLATPGGEALVLALDRAAVVEGRVVDGHGDPVANAQVELTVRDMAGAAPPVWLSGSTVAFRDALFTAEARGPAPLVPAGELGVVPGRVPIVPLVPVPAGVTADRAAPGFVTDADGRFRVEEVPPGVMVVAVGHPAYVRAETEARVVQAGEDVVVSLTVHTGGTLDGRVLTERGFPVGGTQVEVRSAQDPLPRRVFSARDGTFRVPGVLGRVVLVAYAGARVAARAEVDVADDATVPVALTIPGALRQVEGRVVDGRGFPVGGAVVTLTSLDRAALGAAITVTQDDGTFDTVVGGAGPLAVDVRHPEHAPRSLRVDDPGHSIRVELGEGAALSLEVRGDGCMTGDARVEVRTTCGPVHTGASERVPARLEHLCPGRAAMVVDAPGCIRAERSAVLPVTGSVDLGRVDLVSGGGAEGEVTDARGDPVAGALVAPPDAPADATTGTARSGRRGEFTVANLPAGDVTLVATHPALGRSQQAVVRVIRATMARGVRLRFEGEIGRATRAAQAPSVTLVDGRGGVEVGAVAPGSGAERAGIRPGDRVVSVGAVPVRLRAEAVRLFTGARGDDVVLELERDGVRRTVRYTR